jgi:hypothetical protein
MTQRRQSPAYAAFGLLIEKPNYIPQNPVHAKAYRLIRSPALTVFALASGSNLKGGDGALRRLFQPPLGPSQFQRAQKQLKSGLAAGTRQSFASAGNLSGIS